MTGIHQAIAGGTSFPTATFIGTNSDLTNLTTYTFTAQSLGTADSSRVIVIYISTSGSGSATAITSVTIGGVSATKAVGVSPAAGTACEMWYAAVPTGTTGTIVVNTTSGSGSLGIQWWALYKLQSATPVATGSQSATGTSASPTLSSSVSNGSIVIASVTSQSGATHTWSGLTEDCDFSWDAPSSRVASGASATRQSGTISATATLSTSSAFRAVIAAWR